MAKLEDVRDYANEVERELANFMKARGINISTDAVFFDEVDYYKGRVRACKAYMHRKIKSELVRPASTPDILTPSSIVPELDSYCGPAFTEAHEYCCVQEFRLRQFVLENCKDIPKELPSTKDYREKGQLYEELFAKNVAEKIGEEARATPSCSPTYSIQ